MHHYSLRNLCIMTLNKSSEWYERGNFFLKINKARGNLINKKSRTRTCMRKTHQKRIRFPPILFRTRWTEFRHGFSILGPWGKFCYISFEQLFFLLFFCKKILHSEIKIQISTSLNSIVNTLNFHLVDQGSILYVVDQGSHNGR